MENQQYAVGWGTLALINTNIAQLKGYNATVAFFGSLLLGPIVTLILAVKPRDPTGGAPAA